MLARLRYLLEEGFDIEAVTSLDRGGGLLEGQILYKYRGGVTTEEFVVGHSELAHCAVLFAKSPRSTSID